MLTRATQTFTMDANGVLPLIDNRKGRPVPGQFSVESGAAMQLVPLGGVPFVLTVDAAADLGGGTLTFVVAWVDTEPTGGDWEDMLGPSGVVSLPAPGLANAYQHPAPWIGVELSGATGADVEFVVSV